MSLSYFRSGRLPTNYAYVCVNRVSIDPVIQCCTSTKLCCGFMNILYYRSFCNAVQNESTDSQSDTLQFIYRGSQILVASIGRTQQDRGHQNCLNCHKYLS